MKKSSKNDKRCRTNKTEDQPIEISWDTLNVTQVVPSFAEHEGRRTILPPMPPFCIDANRMSRLSHEERALVNACIGEKRVRYPRLRAFGAGFKEFAIYALLWAFVSFCAWGLWNTGPGRVFDYPWIPYESVVSTMCFIVLMVVVCVRVNKFLKGRL